MKNLPGRIGKEPRDNLWDFDGSCAPHPGGPRPSLNMQTFSLGIFKWRRKSSGSGFKRGPVTERVFGSSNCQQSIIDAHNEARRICQKRQRAEQGK